MSTDPKLTDAQFRKAARRIYHNEGTLEIDDLAALPTATVSRTDPEDNGDDGAYVLAWVWVSNDEAAQEPAANKKVKVKTSKKKPKEAKP